MDCVFDERKGFRRVREVDAKAIFFSFFFAEKVFDEMLVVFVLIRRGRCGEIRRVGGESKEGRVLLLLVF